MAQIFMSDHNGETVVHWKDFYTSKDHVTPKPYRYVNFVEHNGRKKWPKSGTDDMSKLGFSAQTGSHWMSVRATQSTLLNSVHNRALAKLHDELTICENLFETWYERQQAYDMLVDALNQVFDFVTNWRNPRWWLKKKLKAGMHMSTLPQAWLYYNFGLKPLIGTIDTCMKGLAQPLPKANVSGTARVRVKERFPDNTETIRTEYSYVYKLGCTAIPNKNPNVGLANVMGLTTPFSTAMSVVPWGWALDYFVNASQLMSNFENVHPGVTISKKYRTIFMKGRIFGHHPWERNGKYYYVVDQPFVYVERQYPATFNYKLELSFPLLGSNQAANLTSAIALSMKGGK